AERVRRFAEADTHIPERSFALVPALQDAPALLPADPADPEERPRPILLLDRPEPLEVVAQVPDSPPLRFRWRRAAYEVARADGPERIACEWWRDGRGARTRDYYRVEDREGRRFWLFRHGLYGRETADPRWYMHGLFA